jgi:hypothetical protein
MLANRQRPPYDWEPSDEDEPGWGKLISKPETAFWRGVCVGAVGEALAFMALMWMLL